MSASFDVLERGAGVLYGACAGIWVMILFAEPTVTDMRLARPSLRTMSRRHPLGFPTLTWVLPEAGVSMENEARKTAAQITDEYAKAIVANATLIEGTGFRAATVRTIVAGLDMMSRSASAKKVFAELLPAVAWCMARCPVRDSASESDVAASIFAARTSIVLGR